MPVSSIYDETPETAKALSALGAQRVTGLGRTLFTFPTAVKPTQTGQCDRTFDRTFTFGLNDPRRLGGKMTSIVLYWSAIRRPPSAVGIPGASIGGWSEGYVSIAGNGYTDSYWVRPVMPTLPNRTIQIEVPPDRVREHDGLTIMIHSDTEHRGRNGCLSLLVEALEIKVR